jgi:hypothetical protein
MDRITLKFRSDKKRELAQDMLRLCGRLGFLPGYTTSWNSDKPNWITIKKKRKVGGSFPPRK